MPLPTGWPEYFRIVVTDSTDPNDDASLYLLWNESQEAYSLFYPNYHVVPGANRSFQADFTSAGELAVFNLRQDVGQVSRLLASGLDSTVPAPILIDGVNNVIQDEPGFEGTWSGSTFAIAAAEDLEVIEFDVTPQFDLDTYYGGDLGYLQSLYRVIGGPGGDSLEALNAALLPGGAGIQSTGTMQDVLVFLSPSAASLRGVAYPTRTVYITELHVSFGYDLIDAAGGGAGQQFYVYTHDNGWSGAIERQTNMGAALGVGETRTNQTFDADVLGQFIPSWLLDTTLSIDAVSPPASLKVRNVVIHGVGLAIPDAAPPPVPPNRCNRLSLGLGLGL